MIESHKDYRAYRAADLEAYGVGRLTFYKWCWMDSLRFQLRLRKIEYLYNTRGHNPIKYIAWFVLEVVNHWLGVRLGFSIPKNVFGPGLCIVHPGTIVVNPKACVGSYCRIHPSTCIGDYDGVPIIGDWVYIGPGAKLYGSITVGDNTAVGANAVVNKSYPSDITIAGIPSKIVSKIGAREQGVFPKELVTKHPRNK